jgi:palmitoyltransferase ZDHHC9/14/18/palmitoyltransferase
MEEIEEDKKTQNEISTSVNILNEKEKEDKKEKEEKEEKIVKEETEVKEKKDDKENNEENEKEENNEGITLEDLKNIILEPEEEEKDQNQEETIDKKDSGNLSRDEILETELSTIKKNNLKKYLMVNNQFKSTSSESEEEIVQKKNKIKQAKCKLYQFVGRTLFVFLDKNENPLIIIGPHWPMYVCFCGIISLLMLAVYLTIWQRIGLTMRIIGDICYWTFFISYTHCSLINPGYPKNDEGRTFGHPREEYYFCTLCHFYVNKYKYAHHCFDCDICIENQDHHCPWTGHCIGKNNFYSFYIFVGASFCIILYLATAVCIGASSYN